MTEKKSLNFLTQFYNHLGLLQGVDLFHFEKILISESGTPEFQTVQIFGRFPGGCKLISEYFESTFCFIGLTIVKVSF